MQNIADDSSHWSCFLDIAQAILEKLGSLTKVTAQDIVWVLTVPVCCSPAASEFMRHCAAKAGFYAGEDNDEVRCALMALIPWYLPAVLAAMD